MRGEDTSEATAGTLHGHLLMLESSQADLAAAWRLSLGEMSAIRRIRHAGGTTPSQLRTQLHLSSAGATTLVQRLEDRGWLRRRANATDGRSVVLDLTEASENRLGSPALVEAAVETVTNGLSPDERAVVLRWLEQVVRVVASHQQPAERTGRCLVPPSMWS